MRITTRIIAPQTSNLKPKILFLKHAPAFAILAFHFLIFAVVNRFLNPHPDMVDHWVWSRYLSLSYYEHPPMIALLIRFITLLAGNSEFALESGSQLVMLGIIAMIYAGTFRLYGREAALVTLLILCGMPYFTIGSIFLHITQPFLIFWILALFLLVRFHRQPSKNLLLWIGVVAGLGALSKYIMLLFYIGLFLHLLLFRKNRKELLNPRLYAAGMISLLIFIPVLIWNAQHDWISFRWQLEKGTGGADFGENTIFFTVGHLLLFSPLWAMMGGVCLWWMRERLVLAKSPESVVAVLSLFPLLFFTAMSFKGSISDPHWVNLAYLGVAILLGNQLLRKFRKRTVYLLLLTGIMLNVSLTGFVLAHTFKPLFDWLPYELKNFDYLANKNVPETILNTLRKNDDRYYNTAQYRKHLQKILSPQEYQKFGGLIQKTALDISVDRLTRLLNWNKTAEELRWLLLHQRVPRPAYIVSREYQLSSALSFYLQNQSAPVAADVPVWPHSIEKAERNLWSPIEAVKKGPSIFVCELHACQASLTDFRKHFRMPLRYLGEVETRRNSRLLRNLQIYSLIPGNAQTVFRN